ncbi:MAG: hypothetical protein H8D45_01795 [Bacteroidetes bacterium]|nr:hypothetical protein [Bacteroidota bacterium]
MDFGELSGLEMNEILVVPISSIHQFLKEKRFIKIDFHLIHDILRHGTFKERDNMETDVNYKQIIPYVIIKNHINQILCYRRSTKSGEERLHNRLSIGIGGHIEKNDEEFLPKSYSFKGFELLGFSYNLFNSLLKEVYEEVGIRANIDDIEIVGIINDDRTNVGRVHLGVVCLLELDDEIDINLGETDILLERQLLSLDDIREHYSGLEEWSKIIIDNKSQVFS